VPDGTTLNVSRNLTIAPGAGFDVFTPGTVNVAKNVNVRSNAIFAPAARLVLSGLRRSRRATACRPMTPAPATSRPRAR
jgi:hypothetical protein